VHVPPTKDKLLEAIEAVHAAGLDEGLWPNALGAAAGLVRANCVTLETWETQGLRHLGFKGFNVPPADELSYLADFVPLNPRLPIAARHTTGDIFCDHTFLSEGAMDRDPFYMEFLKAVGLRYFACGLIERTAHAITGVGLHRPRKHGQFERREIALLQRLLPHFRQAYDVAKRLRQARDRDSAFQSALDWLADGVALLAADGAVLYANEALQRIVRANDGIKIVKRKIVFAAVDAATRLASALASAARLHAGDPDFGADPDFAAARPSRVPPYVVSLRPLLHGQPLGATQRTPVAALFVHDPLKRGRHAAQIFREACGLTEAEANLALALQQGTGVADYARTRGLSLNTAYTHLRRVKEKTGCHHMAELILWLNDLRLPLRTLLLGAFGYLRLVAEMVEVWV
jgi:DNA-binding CsgD family transcriptional regulator